MKKILLLAAVAACATAAMAETKVIYSQDYETCTTGAKNGKSDADAKTWRSQYWQIEGNCVSQVNVLNDAEHGNYVQIMQRASNWSGGGAYCLFKDDATLYADTTTDPFSMEKKGIMKYSVEFDAAIFTTLNAYTKGGNLIWGGPSAQFAVLNPNFSTANKWRADYGLDNKEDQNEAYDNVMFLKQLTDSIAIEMPAADTYSMEGTVPYYLQNLQPLTTPVTLPTDGSWNHWKVDVDRSTYEVTLTVGGEVKASYKADPELEVSLVLRGLYFRTGTGMADTPCYVNIDNLKVTADVPTETGIDKVSAKENMPTKTIKYIKDGVFYIATPQGTFNAAGVAVK